MANDEQIIAEQADELAFWKFQAIYHRAWQLGARTEVEESPEWKAAEADLKRMRETERE